MREICTRRAANVAAVNYHFGDKLGLYREVLQPVIAAVRATTEEARRAGEGFPPAERLRRYLLVYLRRVLVDGGGHTVTHRLISLELADPTPLFDDLIDGGMRPRIEYLTALAAEMIGCPRSDPRVARTVASIQSQMVFYFPHPLSSRLGLAQKLTPDEVDRIAGHIASSARRHRCDRARLIRHHRPRDWDGVRRAVVDSKPMTISTATRVWADGVCAGIHASGCRHVVYVPGQSALARPCALRSSGIATSG